MSSTSAARRTKSKVIFAGVDITDDIAKKLLSLQYTDNEEDATDDLQLVIEDSDYVWLTKYLNAIVDAAAESDGEGTSSDSGSASTTHTVAKGDTLWGIAATYLGDGARYMEIYNANTDKISNPNIIYPGQVLTIPGSDSSETPSTEYKNKGLRIQAVFVRENWNSDGKDKVLDTGECALDDISCSGPPNVLTFKATSLPMDTAVGQTKKNQAWEAYYLSSIAKEIASRAGMECMYESDADPYYDRVEQVKQSDISFLSALCHNSGISLKVTSNTIVLFDQAKYEAAEPVITITKGCGYLTYRLKTGQCDTEYGSCEISYTDPVSRKTYKGSYADPDAEDDAQVLSLNMRVTSNSEAAALAKKMLRLKNKFERKCEFTFPGDPSLVAGVTVILKGWGMFDGKYIISASVHSLGSSGYTTKITLRRVLEGY
jgi:phage protein D